MRPAINPDTVAAQVAWGAYWLAMADAWPAYRAACHHNANMVAMNVLALEACA